MARYSSSFYRAVATSGERSASYLLPLLIERFRPTSIADVGCGAGAWLSVAEGLGVARILGFDNSTVPLGELRIPQEAFQLLDLAVSLPKSSQQFDMVLCLEVAEHLDSSRAPDLVRSLSDLSDCVIFSAAIPGQAGTHHVNCQWPDYWANLFAAHGYECDDELRFQLWDSPLEFWYAQNLLVFTRSEVVPTSRHKARAVIHPEQLRSPRFLLFHAASALKIRGQAKWQEAVARRTGK